MKISTSITPLGFLCDLCIFCIPCAIRRYHPRTKYIFTFLCHFCLLNVKNTENIATFAIVNLLFTYFSCTYADNFNNA